MSPEEVLALGRSRGHLSPPGRGPDPRGACRGAGWAEEGLRERKDRREDLGVHPRGHGWVGLSLADLGRRSCARSWQAEVSEGGSQGRGLGAQGATWTRRCQAGTWPYSPGRLPAGLFIVGDKHTRRHCEHRRTRTPLAFFRSAQRSWEGWGGGRLLLATPAPERQSTHGSPEQPVPRAWAEGRSQRGLRGPVWQPPGGPGHVVSRASPDHGHEPCGRQRQRLTSSLATLATLAKGLQKPAPPSEHGFDSRVNAALKAIP